MKSGGNKLIDVTTSVSNQFGKSDRRDRRASDEYNKSSIVRLTNEAKSTIGDREKKQERILLSPVPAVNGHGSGNGSSVFEFSNSENEHSGKWSERNDRMAGDAQLNLDESKIQMFLRGKVINMSSFLHLIGDFILYKESYFIW